MKLDDSMDKHKDHDHQLDIEDALQNEKANSQCEQYNQQLSKLFWGLKFPYKLSKQQILQLKRNQISFNQNQFQQDLNIIVIDKDANSQVVRLAVSFSYFMIELTVLNLIKNSISDDFKLLGFGAFSKIYQYQTQNSCMAIKSLDFIETKKANDEIEKTLKKAILQFSICKIFSVLQVASKINKLFGFDILIFQNKVQFSMEICKEVDINTVSSLQNQLLLIHSLGFIHGDIKPQNIMWSQTYQKNVFIDFGLSQIMIVQIGKKVETKFFGTYGYCCQQMKKLFLNNKYGCVDLYYNDIFALNKVSRSIAKGFRKAKNFKQDKQIDFRKNRNFVDNILLKSIIFEQDIGRLNEFIEDHRFIMIEQETIELVGSLNNSPTLNKIKQSLQLRLLVNFDHKNDSYFQTNQINIIIRNRERRIKGLCEDFNGTVNDLMLYMMLYHNIDVTPFSLKRSKELKEFLSNSSALAQNYWSIFIEYVNNCNVTRLQILEIFQIVKEKIGISQWNTCNLEEAKIYGMAREIAMKVWISKINLFEIQENFNTLNVREMSIERIKNLNNYKEFPYVEFLAEFRKQIFNYQKTIPKVRMQVFLKCLADVQEKFKIKEVPLPIFLIEKRIQLQLHQKSGQYKTLLSNFLAYFKHFQLAHLNYEFTFFRRLLLLDDKNSLDAERYYELSINKLGETNSFYFTIKQAMHMYFYEAMKGKWNDPNQIQLFINQDLLRIADFAFSFQAYFVTEKLFETFYFLFRTIHSKHVMIKQQRVPFQLSKVFILIMKKCEIVRTFKTRYNILLCLLLLLWGQVEFSSEIKQLFQESFDEALTKIQLENEQNVLAFFNSIILRKIEKEQNFKGGVTSTEKLVNIIRQGRPDLMASAQFLFLCSFKIKCSVVYEKQNPQQQINNFFKLLCDKILILQKVDLLSGAFLNISYYFKNYPNDLMNLFLTFVSIVGKQELKQLNLYFEQCFTKLFLFYFFDVKQQQRLKRNVEDAFELMEAKFHENSSYFSSHYTNCIYVIDKIFSVYFSTLFNSLKSDILKKCIYIALFLRNDTSFYLIRKFGLAVPFWKAICIERGIIFCSKRSSKIAHIKCFRNCQYFCPHEKCFLQFDETRRTEQNSIKGNDVRKKMMRRWDKITQNKKGRLNGDFLNMSQQRKPYYLMILNRKYPYQTMKE